MPDGEMTVIWKGAIHTPSCAFPFEMWPGHWQITIAIASTRAGAAPMPALVAIVRIFASGGSAFGIRRPFPRVNSALPHAYSIAHAAAARCFVPYEARYGFEFDLTLHLRRRH